MRRIAAVLLVVLGCTGCAGVRERALADEALAMYPAQSRHFASEAELVAWLKQARDLESRAARLRQARWERRRPRAGDDGAGDLLDSIMVTGSRLTASDLGYDSITNNQEGAVDEGDIVKKAGDFVFVLSNGVLNVVRVSDGGADTLALADRLVVDEDGEDDTWYDEILAHGDRLFLLGFSYGDGEVSELRAFRVDPDGRLHRDGVFWLRSQDYFSASNYGVRLHDGHLVLSLTLPLDLDDDDVAWPEWTRADLPTRMWRPLLRAEDLHYPVYMAHGDVSMHVALRCPLAGLDAGTLDCAATGVVGGGESVIYVSARNTWLAVGGLAPEAVRRGDAGLLRDWRDEREGEPMPWTRERTAVFRIPHDGAPAGFATVAGEVRDALDFAESGDDLWLVTRDGAWWESGQRVALHRIRGAALGTGRDAPVPPHATLALDGSLEYVRFADAALWLASSRFDDGDGDGDGTTTSALHVVPLGDGPTLEIPVDLEPETLQPLFGRMLVVGLTEPMGLGLALYSDTAAPRRLSTFRVAGRISAESRTHALNFGRLPAGTTLLGLPTLAAPAGDADRRDEAADLEFFALHGDTLRPAGRLDMRDQVPVECEYSCYDWYGAARLFFVGDRIFALSGTLMKEARLSATGVRTVRSVALAPARTAE